MSISSQERHMPDQVNNGGDGGGGTFSRKEKGNGHNHIMDDDIQEPTSHGPTFRSLEEDQMRMMPYKEVARYRECLKNHAAAIGGNATDGCGEFMPGGEEGTLEALKCSACNCHRNFHRKEIEGHDDDDDQCFRSHQFNNVELVGYPTGTLISSRTAVPPLPPHRTIMPYYKVGYLSNSQSDHEHEQEEGGGGIVKRRRRFRTKFSQEQKEKMLSFAEKVGWKIQKLEESVVQQFCQEIGIKRRVLKVWMHNNKHNLAKKNTMASTTSTTTTT